MVYGGEGSVHGGTDPWSCCRLRCGRGGGRLGLPVLRPGPARPRGRRRICLPPFAATGPHPAVAAGAVAMAPRLSGRMRLRHRAWHLRVWLCLAVLLPTILLGAVVLRQDGPAA